jgi:hypothetical protein
VIDKTKRTDAVFVFGRENVHAQFGNTVGRELLGLFIRRQARLADLADFPTGFFAITRAACKRPTKQNHQERTG